MIEKSIDPTVFRTYDIRGIVEEQLNRTTIYAISRAIASFAASQNEKNIIVARDGRLSGLSLSDALIQGLVDSGCHVTDVGMVPTPVLYFATHILKIPNGVMLTGSHNPANYNGLKIVIGGKTLAENDIQDILRRTVKEQFIHGEGKFSNTDIIPTYIQKIKNDVRLEKLLKVVIDCGNGVTGIVAPALFEQLNCDVIPMYCEIDGNFPNHHPDPTDPNNLQDLITRVKQEKADVGLAFDGDGDRLGVVTKEGNIIWADRLLMLYAIDLLKRYPGSEILFDVKCTTHLAKVIQHHGGKPIMYKTGHSLIKGKMLADNILLAGEMSGHLFFKERWYGFDDGIYAAARLLEILSQDERSPQETFNDLPDGFNTPELRLPIPEKEKFAFMERFIKRAHFPNATIFKIDGLRVDFKDGWGLLRCSNTTPCLILRFEGDNEEALVRIQQQFRQQLLALDPTLILPF